MSNLIPPLLSSTPPPIIGPLEEEDDDEFGDFRTAANPYDCDDLSLPASPQKSPEKEAKSDLPKVNLDINSNSQKIRSAADMLAENIDEPINKDFQDRRKSLDESANIKLCESQVNCSHSQLITDTGVCIVDSSEVLSESQIVTHSSEEDSVTFDFVDSIDQNIVHNDSSTPDDFSSNIKCGEKHCETHCDENHLDTTIEDLEKRTNKIIIDDKGQGDLNLINNEQNIFEDFSQNIHLVKTISDDLSELNEINEIKSEEDYLDGEINSQMINKHDIKDDKLENSLKDSNCESTDLSLSIRIGETDPKLSDDEFGDFEDHVVTENQKYKNVKFSADDEFDDFISPLSLPQTTVNLKPEEHDDDFGEFASSNLTKDFDDFGDFSAHTLSVVEKPIGLEIDTKNVILKSENILKDMFPVIEKEIDDFELVNETKGNIIFEELRDITETNALLYQWSKSSSQKMLLKSLNIDMRNILYGPAWNSSMPRFAANLGLTPLEPVKSEMLTPTQVQQLPSSPSNSSQKNQSDIPTAQFDWSGSGLINPLDYLEQLVASLDIPSTTNVTSDQSPTCSSELLYEWDLWLNSTSTELPGGVPEDSSELQTKNDFLSHSEKSEPLSNLFEAETLPKPINEVSSTTKEVTSNFELPKSANEQLDHDFTQFQSPKVLIPLRETHISNDFGSKPGWLEPTILTPDLPRKESIINPDDDDEFDDFQMVLPVDIKEQSQSIETDTDKIYLPDMSEFDLTKKVNKTLDNQEHILEMTKPELSLFSSGPIDPTVQKIVETSKHSEDNDDDEFTDFHSHSSLPQSDILIPLQPVPVEPLKPSIQYTSFTTQINWPEPGVTDEDVRNIELSYSRASESKPNLDRKNSADTCKGISTTDEDEWSDFVSVSTNPAKVSVMPERTSTPDLPLSVLNLNHVQPPKQPIPVITPAGLIQTKLSSNLLLQPKSSNVVQTVVQQNMFKPQPTQFQPSIISDQFAANLYLSKSCSESGTATASITTNQSQDDDDDWSDFVSSQPLPQISNGYQPKPTFSHTKVQQTNWTNVTTNIIMNPSHFDSFSNYVPQQNKKTMAVKNTIPSISTIPELEFIAPKNRTKK